MDKKSKSEKKRQKLVDHILDELVIRKFTEYEARGLIRDLNWAVYKCISAHKEEKKFKKA